MDAMVVYCIVSFIVSIIVVGILVYFVWTDRVYIDFHEIIEGVTYVELVVGNRRFLLAKWR